MRPSSIPSLLSISRPSIMQTCQPRFVHQYSVKMVFYFDVSPNGQIIEKQYHLDTGQLISQKNVTSRVLFMLSSQILLLMLISKSAAYIILDFNPYNKPPHSFLCSESIELFDMQDRKNIISCRAGLKAESQQVGWGLSNY